MSSVLTVNDLSKKYGSFVAVDSISFSVEKGKILGFLGPNGAGKTTTIQMLLGISSTTSGSIEYFGKDFFKNRQEILQRINFASAYNTLQGRISVWENLVVFARLYSVKNAEKKVKELLEYFEISDLLSQRFWDLSAGQKTRVNIIKAMLNKPELLLLDEPTASLDPDIADKVLTFVEQLKNDEKLSILYTSHNMEEVTRICDEVIILNHGKIVAQDTPLQLTKRIDAAQLKLTFEGSQERMKKYLSSKKQNYTFHNKFTVNIDTKESLIPKLIFGLTNEDIYITDIEVKKPTLEDVFLSIAREGQK
jgi:ABC-2 type transport system ATP-binding protein